MNNSNPRSKNRNSIFEQENNNPGINQDLLGNSIKTPEINLPKAGGAIRGIDEKFQVNAVNGTSSFSIPMPYSPSRGGYTPSIGLTYSSGLGNSEFGLGWQLGLPSISRKTENELPQYKDEKFSDTFVLTGAEDLVPLLEKNGDEYQKSVYTRNVKGISFSITRFRPRIESTYSRIERWTNSSTGEAFWKTISPDNIHSYYGLSVESRIQNPGNSSQVFSWKLCRICDDKGNITLFEYKQEDFAGIEKLLNERNRKGKTAQTYLKKILYGNKTPYYLGEAIPDEDNFLFQMVFDYGEHNTADDIPQDIYTESSTWNCRKDSFSSYRAGFEQRTYRRCERVLMFHCFDEELPHSPYLTKSLQLIFEENLQFKGSYSTENGFSFIKRYRLNGHKWSAQEGHYTTKYLPELEISYQQHEWNTEIIVSNRQDSLIVPNSIADSRHIWIDLYGEGISGVLTEEAGAWYYNRNLGGAKFEAATEVLPKPSFTRLSNQEVAIQDLEGNGTKYLVHNGSEPKGFFKFKSDEEWEPFKSFPDYPNLNLSDSNIRTLDLTGDGKLDLLYTSEDSFLWSASKGEAGFEVSKRVYKAIDEEKGPSVLFSDQEQSIFLADMSGDGLTDIVRIRYNSVCYWPNLGYGNFGAKVTMDNAPQFGHFDQFNPLYIRIADMDGSGTSDLIYLGENDFRIWMNQNGNKWSIEPHVISSFPSIHNMADVTVLDLLGTGTACIVYASALKPQELIYIDLMGSKKPNLLTGYNNNTGLEVTLSYKPSTFYYLEDKREGNDWISKLPFPIQCVDSVRSEDKIRETVFTHSYRYGHGYYDYEEREFRGFARVEQTDTEDFAVFSLNNASNVVQEDLHQPPVKVITWFHTGAYTRNNKILNQCKSEYYKNNLFTEYKLPEPEFDVMLTTEELREAHRALKGLTLRTEVYALDDSENSHLPYTASQASVNIQLVQPKSINKFASFQVISSESVSYGYERNPADPRIGHSFVLETDELGNITKSASVIYPRVSRPAVPDDITDKIWDEQNQLRISYAESLYTNDILLDDIYRLRNSYESKSYEISGITQPSGFYLNRKKLASDIASATEILFEEEFTSGIQKRLLAHERSYFLKDDLSGPQVLGQLSNLAIDYKSCKMAFTEGLITTHYDAKVTDTMLTDAKYVHSEGDKHWWIQTGDVIYSANPASDFYIPARSMDVYGNESTVEYDDYKLLVKSVTDAIGNSVSSVNDYRTLTAVEVQDANLNRSAVEIDELGMVIKKAVMGKVGSTDGDSLNDPTSRVEYDPFNWKVNSKPNYVHVFKREKHGAANNRWQEEYVYSDGGGNIIMTKSQVDPGKANKWDEATNKVIEVDADPRWIGNGRVILNNKGNPVKQYEPYFSSTHAYESEAELVETGVSPIVKYDPMGRAISSHFPNGTFNSIEFDSWKSSIYDVIDTVRESEWYSDRGSPDPLLISEPSNPEERAAWLAAKHSNTPATVHLDVLGRPCYSITNFGNGNLSSLYSETDFAGRYAEVYDQKDRLVSEGYTNMLGAPIYSKSAEKGKKWMFSDVMGRLVKAWENNIRELRTTYDKLHRPVSSYIKEGGTEYLFTHMVYGDLIANAENHNLLGKAYQIYDQTGVVTFLNIDFKGNILRAERRLTKDYTDIVNWDVLEGLTNISEIETTAAPLLESEVFSSTTEVDAINRAITSTLPDGSVVRPTYTEANTLDKLDIQLRGAGNFITFLENQNYNAKGQRLYAEYGNGLVTNYKYDPQTLLLTNLITKKKSAADLTAIQNRSYTFDPVGNIVFTKDDAQQTHFFQNSVVKPEGYFEYDALYRLITAKGREHAGAMGSQINHEDIPFLSSLPHANNANAIRNYAENYLYDECGNILRVDHKATGGNWTRNYRYHYQDDPTNNTNQLKCTSVPGDPIAGPYTAVYVHDMRGNITSMPHINQLAWNFMDQLSFLDLGGGGKAYYNYSIGGNRIRKVIERQGGKRLERIYLGAVEIYREYQGDSKRLERNTLHISDISGNIAQVDTKLLDLDNSDSNNALNTDLIRYQYSNHLDSTMLETDENGILISYEDYHPYGTSAYRVSKSGTDLSLKRYRFSGKERDDESGLYYFGSRFYSAWLGRWISSDPAGMVDGLNLYQYCSGNPINYCDPNGQNGVVAMPRNAPQEVRSALRVNTDEARTTIARYLTGKTFGNQEYTPGSIRWDAGRGQNWAEFRTVGTGGDSGGNQQGSGGSDPPPAPPASGDGGDNGEGGDNGGNNGSLPIPPRPAIQPGPVPTSPVPTSPVPKLDMTQAPPGTNFRRLESAARQTYRDTNTMRPGEQVQHPAKWRDGARTNLHPRITNDRRFLHPIQSRKAHMGGRTHTVGGRTYGTDHTYADRGLYPREAGRLQRRYGNVATERVTHLWAGRNVRGRSTGSRGPLFLREYIWAPMLRGMAGHACLAATRTFIPGVVEAEMGLMGGGMLLYNAGYTAAGTAMFSAAAYVPVVGGGLVAGAFVGNAAESIATELGASEPVAQGVGALGAVGGGAAVGALIGSVIPGVGTAAGAVVGGIAGLIGYGISKLF